MSKIVWVLTIVFTLTFAIFSQARASLTCSESFGESALLDRALERASEYIETEQTNAELADLIISMANRNLTDPSQATPRQIEAFRIARILKGNDQVRWTSTVRYRDNPYAVELGPFPHQGIESVTAHIVTRDLKKNDRTVERLTGITFEIRLIEGDSRLRELSPIIVSNNIPWGKPNIQALIKRRNRVISILRGHFDGMAREPHTRIIHHIISLSRPRSQDLNNYVIPGSDVNPHTALRESTLSERFLYELRREFNTALTGEREAQVMTGYQNGDSRNRSTNR
ncbi:MAG: hypothetical protein HRT44_08675 [Bdellovibrionales bacterium]|nr:hypothetical protein [Bdellovibrionales bacterium]NQZ19314.1 hypothetical protein [Bdellovibrionales bacterium]